MTLAASAPADAVGKSEERRRGKGNADLLLESPPATAFTDQDSLPEAQEREREPRPPAS